MNNKNEIRVEELRDSDKIYSILKDNRDLFETGIKSDEDSLKEYAKKLASLSHFVTVYMKNELASFIVYYANDYESHIAYGILMGITKEFQEKGIVGIYAWGKMMDYVKKQLKGDGFNTLRFEVQKENKEAIRLYENGGSVYEKDVNEDSVYMRWSLDNWDDHDK